MKKTILISAVLLLLQSCSQPHPAYNPYQPHQNNLPAEVATRGRYIALPGQEAVRVQNSDTNAAFDEQVALYQSQQQGAATPQPVVPFQESFQPTPVVVPEGSTPGLTPGIVSTAPTISTPVSTAPAGKVDYTIKVTNGTNGRLFVEAQDAAGEIYPCGFMWGQNSYSTKKEGAAPIKGPITVVVRDPDQPGAPELRRYKVTPPANYNGKTIGITIVPGGMYQVTLDGQHYYTSPAPAAPANKTATETTGHAAPAAPPAGI